MERIRSQAKEMFPSVYLTLLSMIQALALEALWSAVNERSHLWEGGPGTVSAWLQVTATAQTIFFVWIAFTLLVIRLRWAVSVWDSAIPFVLGFAQFALVALIAPGRMHLWFFVASATAAFGVWGNYALTREALREPENVEVIAAYGRTGHLAAYGPLVAWVLYGLLAGGLVRAFGEAGRLGVALTAIANVLAFGLILWVADSWRIASRR